MHLSVIICRSEDIQYNKKFKIMTSDDPIETIIGGFGRYQTWILVIISFGRMPTDYQLSNVVFILPSVEYVCMDDAYNLTNHCPCENPVYDESTIISSVTSTWNLICDKKYFASLAQSFLQVGILVGSVFYGYVSDRYGRKFACLLALCSEIIFVAMSAAVPYLWMFIFARFLMGTGVGGTILCCFVMIVELCGKSIRPYSIGMSEISYIVTYITLPGIAYLIRNWRQLQLALSVPWLLVFLYYFFLTESPRWLITVGKKEEAIRVLTNIAKKNNRPTDDIVAIVESMHKETARGNRQQYATFLDLFKTSKIRTNTLIVAFVWLCNAHTYFGLQQYIGRLQGDIYLNVMLSGISLTPSVVLTVIANVYFPRKTTVIFSYIVAGASLLSFIFIPNHFNVLKLTFALLGLSGAFTAFIQMYLYSSEVFPTVVRNSGMGFVSVFARFGGFIAPFVVNLGIEWVSIVIFSCLAFCAAILCCFLPETKDIVLLNTIEQTEERKEDMVELK